jgi:uncharacterized protein (TIGR01319 family)
VGIILVTDFGSTYTKVLAIDADSETLIGRAQSLTTVDADITIGMRRAFTELYVTCNIRDSDVVRKFASSSAAGGLKLAAIGLVPALTLEAARRAALSAGAKVVWSSGFELDSARVSNLENLRPDIILLCGGTDGGDKRVILHNARMLAASSLDAPILIAGNNVVAHDIRGILTDAGKTSYVTENVLPELSKLNIEPAKALIREVFIHHITKAKGLSDAQDFIGEMIVPTPKATLQAATLVADGIDGEDGIGPLLIVEVGGATINIHSVSDCGTADSTTVLRGLPETRTKRTVEGDLGIRYNAATILELVGVDSLMACVRERYPDTGMTTAQLEEKIAALSKNVGLVPDQDLNDDCVDFALAKCAAAIAVTRHAGTIKTEYALTQEVKVQHGKDLTRVANVIGTGGLFKYGKWPRQVLGAALYDRSDPTSLKPRSPNFYIDQDYMLYGVGLLAESYPKLGLHLAKKYLRQVNAQDL